ncbi:MAG: MotA/TolQ/ExbB proton channel family protein [Saprospiraceae bacterium]|nr:MotA/TolQ/ExbB proton channel family protein [Saprospiraceae bacterium]
MNTNNKMIVIGISTGLALATWLILIFLADISYVFPPIERFFQLMGGTSGGYIQFFCYAAFFYGMIEIRKMHSSVSKEFEGFDLNLLPDEDQLVLTPQEVAEVKLSIIGMEKRGFTFRISDFIKKACTQYRNDQSISETLQVLDVQIENNKEELEGNLSMVRYLIGAIMSLGFIGTLIGLSSAIGNAHLAKTDEGMPMLTSYLNVAFDTTMVSLILGLILNFFYHSFIEDIDKFYAKSKTYIVDNLISRIYVA